MGPLLTEIIQSQRERLSCDSVRISRDGGEVHDSAKGVAPLKLNLQRVSNKSVSSVAVERDGWRLGGHYKLAH